MSITCPQFENLLNKLADDLLANRTSYPEGTEQFADLRLQLEKLLNKHTDSELTAVPGCSSWKDAYQRAWEALDTVSRRDPQAVSDRLATL